MEGAARILAALGGGQVEAASAPTPAALPVAPPAVGAQERGTLRVLLVCASPKGSVALRLGEEERALRQAIKLAKDRDRFDVETLPAATIDDLRRALLARRFSIVHFAGHGTTEGLVFEDEQGQPFVPDMAALAALLQRHRVETVLLNACYALDAIRAAPLGTRFTIATDGAVLDRGAIELARGFYDALGAGRPVEEAYEEGVSCARLKGSEVRAVLLGGRAAGAGGGAG